MNCEEFERTIVMLDDSGDESEASAHAQICARCALLLKRERGMAIGLAALAADEAAINAPERLRSALRAAFDERHAAGHSFRYWSLRFKVLCGMAAAAMLLLFSITTALFLRERLPKTAVQPATNDRATQLIPDTPEAKEVRRTGVANAVARSTSRRNRRHTLPVKDTFIPLTFVAKSEPTEFVQTLRVEISRSALLTLGVPVNVERGEGLIKAEIIIGEDGVARAVRIIN